MQKLFLKTIMACLALLMINMPEARAEGTVTDAEGITWQEVTTAAEFKTAVKANKNIWLKDNIDLSQIGMEEDDLVFDYDLVFRGRIRADYDNVNNKKSIYALMNIPDMLFQKMENAHFSNLIFYNCKFKGWDTHSGQLAATAKNCSFENVALLSCSSKGEQDDCDCDQMGGLIGIANDCTFKKVCALNTSLVTDGQSAGLIVGEANNCKFTECLTNPASSIWADGNSTISINGNAYAGGLCGYCKNCTFDKCINMAIVSADDDTVGGIFGYGSNTTATDCNNYGVVCHNTKDGFANLQLRMYRIGSPLVVTLSAVVAPTLILAGLSATTTPAAMIALIGEEMLQFLTYSLVSTFMIGVCASAVVAVPITAAAIIVLNYDPDELGGIAGTIKENSIIRKCSNYGHVQCFDAYGGGIVGKAVDSTIEACLNQAMVFGNQQTGGIVGLVSGGTIRYNLNISSVRANSDQGYIEGDTSGSSNTFSNNYFLGIEDHEYAHSHSRTQEQLASGSVALALNTAIGNDSKIGANPFRQDLGNSIYPTLDASVLAVTSTITVTDDMLWQKVSNVGALAMALCNPASKIELTADIDMSGRLSYCNFTKTMPFIGEIKGNGYSLKNCGYSVYHQETQVDAGLFSYAKNAKFSNLVLDKFEISQANQILGHHTHEGLLVANSEGCIYNNVTVRNSSIRKNDRDDWLEIVGGIVGYSKDDRFNGCTTESSCTFEGYSGADQNDTNVGGLAGYATGSNFTLCHNAATIIADDDNDGGIVGHIHNGIIEKCLNTGNVTGEDYVGGIAGEAVDTKIYDCVNDGTISADDGNNDDIGGIVGRLEGNQSIVDYCLGFGIIMNDDSEKGGIYGDYYDGATIGSNNKWHFKYNNETTKSNMTVADITSGKIAFTKTDHNGKTFLYQSLDNGGWRTNKPVPISAAGTVYANVNCSGNTEYSNIYQSAQSHTAGYDQFGVCGECGSVGAVSTVAQPITLTSALDMAKLAYAVNKGQDFSQSEIQLGNNIDFATLSAQPDYKFYGIGNSAHPFSGTFNGNGHTITNLTIDKTWGEAGLFPDVKGTTKISNIVLDSTCVIRSNCYGAGGIVGVTRGHCTLELSQCGFEGFISGSCNVASMLGAVFESSNGSNITINRCYNTGTVNGGSLSAAICGYANDNLTVTDTWNSGAVTGNVSGLPFFRYVGSKGTFTNCHSVHTQSGINKIATTDAASGRLCYLLNGQVNGSDTENSWYQKIGEESHPMWDKRGDDLVYMHDGFSYCEAPSIKITEYNNSAEVVPTVVHTFDDNGFCHRKTGEEHYEPALQDGDEWEVNNMGKLYWIAQQINDGAEQHNINLRCDVTDNENVIVDGALNPDYASFRKWKPIGSFSYPFKKTFWGQRHTVSGLYCPENNDCAGFIGCMSSNDVTVGNLAVVDSYFSNAIYAGGIAGLVNDNTNEDGEWSSIYHCYTSVIIDNSNYAGGIVGKYNFQRDVVEGSSTPIKDCYSTSKLLPKTGEGTKLCGGIMADGGRINGAINCYYLEDNALNVSGYGEAKSKLAFQLGEVCLLMSQSANGWTQNVSTDAAPKFGNSGVKYTRQVTPGNWSSLVLPCEAKSTDVVQLYTFQSYGSDNTLTLTPVESVPANTPCFFKTMDDCTNVSFDFTNAGLVMPSSAQVSVKKATYLGEGNLYLCGTYENIVVTPVDMIYNYFVAKNQLWWGEDAFSLPAFRAYLKLDNLELEYSNAKKIEIMVAEDSETTQIGEIRDGKLNMFGDGKYLENNRIVIKKNNKKYNINGQEIK